MPQCLRCKRVMEDHHLCPDLVPEAIRIGRRHLNPIAQKGSVIQVTKEGHQWYGVIFVVDEIKGWGVIANLHSSTDSVAPVRLEHGVYDYIGEAKVIME